MAIWHNGAWWEFGENGEQPVSTDPNDPQYKQVTKPGSGYRGMTPFVGDYTYGLRDGRGGENAKWAINPETGKEEALFSGPGGRYFASDIDRTIGLRNAATLTDGYNEQGIGSPVFDIGNFNARQTNDTWSGKDGLRDGLTAGSMFLAAYTGGAGLGVEGGATAGTAAFEGGAAAYGSGAELAYGADAAAGGLGADAMSGGGMDWWTELGLTADDVGMSSGIDMSGFGGDFSAEAFGGPQYDMSGFGGDFSADAFGGQQYDMTGFGSDFDVGPMTGSTSSVDPQWMQLAKQYGPQVASAVKSLASKAGAAISGAGGWDTAAALAPILAGIGYAKNQGPFDTSRFESLYSQFNPNALAGSYDQNTSLGRSSLESGLAARGLSGSTFGNDSLTNFNTARDVGRAELISKGSLGAASLASPILDAQIKERALKNDLYGRALYAVGNVFGGRR